MDIISNANGIQNTVIPNNKTVIKPKKFLPTIAFSFKNSTIIADPKQPIKLSRMLRETIGKQYIDLLKLTIAFKITKTNKLLLHLDQSCEQNLTTIVNEMNKVTINKN